MSQRALTTESGAPAADAHGSGGYGHFGRARSPEAPRQATWPRGARGTPASYRPMNGYGSRACRRTRAEAED
ncbi:hypothetical protein AB0D74_41190 [Streptomyces sp. NPDC048278]|uniref:hypothetical protein n=1 Tax=Streptomyces sp. NPDC048278 TaxID=3155809 RepID=UPI00343DC1F7